MRQVIGFLVSAFFHIAVIWLLWPILNASAPEETKPKPISIDIAVFDLGLKPEPESETEPVIGRKKLERARLQTVETLKRAEVVRASQEAEKHRLGRLVKQRHQEWELKQAQQKQRLEQQREVAKKQEDQRKQKLAEQRRLQWEQKQAQIRQYQKLEQQRQLAIEKQAALRKQQLTEKRHREWQVKKAKLQRLADKKSLADKRLAVKRRKEWAQQQAEKSRQAQQATLAQQAQRATANHSVANNASGDAQGAPLITNPQFQSRSDLTYPRLAQRRKLQGQVIIRANVLATGHVRSVQVHRSSGHAVLDNAALKSVRRWVFKPALRNGVAVASIVQMPVSFRLK